MDKGKVLKEGYIPLSTEQFIDVFLERYKEIKDPRNMTYMDFLWYQSRRAFLLEIKEKLKRQGDDTNGYSR